MVEVHNPTQFQTLFYFCTGLGHQAVMVFFILSGFFVGGSILKRKGMQFRPAEYFIARLTRLWIVLIPALAATLIVDTVVAAYFPEVLHGVNYGIWNSGPHSTGYSISTQTLLGNVFFLQTILTPVFGTNSPLWSLANEFWYYTTFPMLAFAVGQCGNPGRASTRIAAGVSAVVLLAFLPPILSGYVVWLMGVVAWLICNRLPCKRRPLALISAFVLFVCSLVYSKSISSQMLIGLSVDYAVGMGFSIFCIVIATWPRPGCSHSGIAISKLAVASSEFSYSLYLTHFPFVMLIAVFCYGSTKVPPDAGGLLLYFGGLAALLVLGSLFWFLFERHTSSMRELATSGFAERFRHSKEKECELQ
jgi:peptidoglycan/LPS O-acetylase OafA/YrhL